MIRFVKPIVRVVGTGWVGSAATNIYLATAKEEVAAIYIWAIAATGRGIAGLGKAAAHLRQLRFRNADCYAQPSTVAGRDIMKATGFKME